MFTEAMVLRGLAGAAAATAVVGAVVMRRWDSQAGKQVADLTRARASDEWRHEERVAELEADLDESRELRVKLEQRLRGKRAELAGLRNEHAALLRRYATSETERASVLEERRVLEIEAAAPAKALPPAPVEGAGAVAASASEEAEVEADVEVAVDEGAPGVFSPEGSRLFLRAKAALARFDEDGEPADDSVEGGSEKDEPVKDEPVKGESVKGESAKGGTAKDSSKDEPPNNEPPKGDGPSGGESVEDGSDAVEAEGVGASETETALEDDPQGKSGAVDGHEHAAATTRPALPAGHFIAPTAVAVVPAAPVRRRVVEGGFDFFGTKTDGASSALESVQNEDLADVVGQEALALHKAESEAEFKPADEESRGIGQVIDLTAHDETEQIDVQGLRSAVS
ncbi:hypothetical protein GCM10018780_78630 [Streptomyces lanatus]|nr:hypothetical protein GCM10018780_78630 [Streptomyces lanatus]